MRRISITHRYDPEMDRTTWRGYNPTFFKPSAFGKAIGEARVTNQRRVAIENRKKAPTREAREDAERHCEETVRRVVQALEMALAHLGDVGFRKIAVKLGVATGTVQRVRAEMAV
jgi:hypothetical protein